MTSGKTKERDVERQDVRVDDETEARRVDRLTGREEVDLRDYVARFADSIRKRTKSDLKRAAQVAKGEWLVANLATADGTKARRLLGEVIRDLYGVEK